MDTPPLNPAERRALLRLARHRLEALTGAPLPSEEDVAAPARLAGAFVSLHHRGRLRGCIGTFLCDQPLGEVVDHMARAAGAEDPRFPPLRADELPELEIEISVLSPRRPLVRPDDLEIGRHGLAVARGGRRGVLLPQVATRFGWDRETFLEEVCVKAGLPRDAWRDADTRLEVFTAEVFGEEDTP